MNISLIIICIDCLPNIKDLITLFLGFLLTVFWNAIWSFLLYLLKPELEISSIEEDKSKELLKIKVVNKGVFNAINLRIEACIVQSSYTYHLELDRDDFLILPPKDFRTFQADDITAPTKRIMNMDINTKDNVLERSKINKNYIRIRVHATHEYSGFGKAFESKFKWEVTENKFLKIK